MQYEHVKKMEAEGVLKDGYKFLAYLEKHNIQLVKKQTPSPPVRAACWCDDDDQPCEKCRKPVKGFPAYD